MARIKKKTKRRRRENGKRKDREASKKPKMKKKYLCAPCVIGCAAQPYVVQAMLSGYFWPDSVLKIGALAELWITYEFSNRFLNEHCLKHVMMNGFSTKVEGWGFFVMVTAAFLYPKASGTYG